MTKLKISILTLSLFLSIACNAGAAEQTSASTNPAVEKRVESITKGLRCLVCQNQTIADSQAELALELKSQVRHQVERGASDQDVIDYMVHRYGDFILYRPPFKQITLLLWLGPFLLLIFSLFYLYLKIRKPRIESEDIPELEIERAAALLAEQPDQKRTT